MTTIIQVIIVYIVVRCVISLSSSLEKSFIVKSKSIKCRIDAFSLKWVKFFIYLFPILISLEYFLFQKNLNIVLGVTIFLVGLFLRCRAIIDLGKFWSFHIEFERNHYRVSKGIYRYFNHPGYIGNVYLIGLSIFFGVLISTVVALVFISLFYYYRSEIENKELERILNSKTSLIKNSQNIAATSTG